MRGPLAAAASRYLAFGLATILAVSYAFFNLHSAWDPASRLTNIRAGLVNDDQPVLVDGSSVAVGEDLSRTLIEGKKFGWRTLKLEEAKQQLRDGEIDFFLHIPADASRLVTGLPTSQTPEQALLAMYANPAFNYPMNQVADTVAVSVREQLNGKIAATYLDKLLGGLDAAVAGVARAADGARQVADGAKSATDGAGELAGGLEKAASGARQLHDGTGQVAAGARSVSSGAVQLRDGNQKLATGLDQAAAGATALAAGGSQLRAGAELLVGGYAQLAKGNEQLSAGLTRAVDGVGQLKRGIQESPPDPVLEESGTAIKEAMKSLMLHKPYLYLDKDFRSLMHHLKVLSARADEVKEESVTKITGALTQLEGGLQQAVDGSNQLASGAWTGYNKGQEFIAGARRLEEGAHTLAGGVRQAAQGALALADGANKLADGSLKLASGADQLQAGGQALAGGLDQLSDGGQRLASGLGQLSGGTTELADGLGKASTGAVIPPRSNASAMSQPVRMVDEKLTPVPRPGEALLAVTIPTALWLGALLLVAGCRLFGSAWGTGDTASERLQTMALPGGALAVAVTAIGLLMRPHVAHPVVLLAFTGLATFSFIALNQMLVHSLGTWGYGVSGLLLILMPVAVGTRAPYILLPAFYRGAAPFLPLSHAVRGVQATVAGGANAVFWVSVAALAIFLALALVVSRYTIRREAGPQAEQTAV